MIKHFLVLLVTVVLCLSAISQDTYEAAIKQAKDSMNKSEYPAAIKLYNAAKAFDPSMSNVVDDSINVVFNLILKQKEAVEHNLDLANAQKKRADFLRKEAEKNLDLANTQKLLAEAQRKIANDALKISHANQIMYEAQGVVKLDPALAMHLAAAALDSIKNIKMESSFIDDSLLIVDKANRIYYENNFGETLISNGNKPDSLGKFTNVAYGPNDKSIWTITDKLYAIKWDMKGKVKETIPLDPAYKDYSFKVLGKDLLVLYGVDPGTSARKAVIKSLLITNEGHSVVADSINNSSRSVKDSLLLNPGWDTSAGWSKRLLVFGYRAFQIKDGKLMPVVTGIGNITVIAFSPDGKLIATNGSNGSKGINIFNTEGTILDSSLKNLGEIPKSLEFFPDNKTLLARYTNFFLFLKITGTGLKINQRLDFRSSYLHAYKLSTNGERILVSTVPVTGNQQVIQLWENRSDSFVLYSQYKCLGSARTSAVFAKDEKKILSSSDKIIIWKISDEQSEPLREIRSEFMTSVRYDEKEHMFTGATFTDKKIKYNMSGDTIPNNNNDSNIHVRLAAFMSNGKVVIVSEDGRLQMYLSKKPIDEFLKNFRFDEFTDEQKKRYGIEN